MDAVTPVTLRGRYVTLEPLTASHALDLAIAGSDPEVWRWLPIAQPAGEAEYARFVDSALADQAAGARVPFAIVARDSGPAIGSTSYLDIEPAHERIEIGWTWLGREWWRTPCNTEAKLLLLTHAFDTLGAGRVALKTDLLNERSQAAIARIGGVRGGVLRRHMRRPDGSWRDTVYFGILRDEWPAVRAALTELLARSYQSPPTVSPPSSA